MTDQAIALATARGTFRVAIDGDAEAPALVLGNSLADSAPARWFTADFAQQLRRGGRAE
jgi:hypothetical protein